MVAVAARHLRVRRRDLLVLRAHQQRARRRQALLRLGELGGGEAARLALRLEFSGQLALAVRPAVHFGFGLEQLRLQLLDALGLVPQVDLPELQQLRLRLGQRRLLLGERRRRLAQPPLEDADGGGRLLRLPPQRRQLGLRLLGLLQRREDPRL